MDDRYGHETVDRLARHGARLRAVRLSLGVEISEVADWTRLSETSILAVERGRPDAPWGAYDTLDRVLVSAAYQVDEVQPLHDCL